MKLRLIFFLIIVSFLSACGGQTVAEPAAGEIELSELPVTLNVDTVAAVKDQPEVFMLDVREQWEYDEGHIPGITLIPMNEIPARLSEIPTDKTVIVTCRSGNRSGQVTDFLRQQGFDNVHNMDGGILAWERAGYEVNSQ